MKQEDIKLPSPPTHGTGTSPLQGESWTAVGALGLEVAPVLREGGQENPGAAMLDNTEENQAPNRKSM